MAGDFQASAREIIKTGEGCINHMYLDTAGKVTIGVGNMLPDVEAAQALPFTVKASGEPATAEQIAAEFNRVSEQDPAHAAGYYAQFCELALSDADIDTLLDRRIAEFENGLKTNFEKFDEYPGAAKLGLLDMAFNLGTSGLVNKFPTFTRAARDENWALCAQECKRRGIQDSRNEEVKDLFLSCEPPDEA